MDKIIRLAFILLLSHFVASQDYEFQIEDGKIRGTTMKTRFGQNFLAFRGIRYAEAPVGDLRFQVNFSEKILEEILSKKKSFRNRCPKKPGTTHSMPLLMARFVLNRMAGISHNRKTV